MSQVDIHPLVATLGDVYTICVLEGGRPEGMEMRTVSVREARQKLKELLDAVEVGDEVIVVRRGKQVARLVPARRPRGPLPDLSALRRAIRVGGRPLSEEIIRMRKGGRY